MTYALHAIETFSKNTLKLAATLTLMSVSFCASALNLSPMSQEKKQESMQQLKALMDSGTNLKALKLSDPDTPVEKAQILTDGKIPDGVYDQKGNKIVRLKGQRGKYFGNGMYNVRIRFVKDRDFPEKYLGEEFFQENKTVAFRDQWTQIIAEHYIGSEWAKYEPIVEALTSSVSLEILIANLEDLHNILEDERVIYVSHIRTPSTPIIESH